MFSKEIYSQNRKAGKRGQLNRERRREAAR